MSPPDPAALLPLLLQMDAVGASDLFICEGKLPAWRVDGAVEPVSDAAPTARAEVEGLLQVALGPTGAAEFHATGDRDCGLSLRDGRRVRLNFSRQQGRLSVVARAVQSGALSAEGLRLPEVALRFADRARGLVLVTGATGSGKSTTLAALVHHINQGRPAHIITIEDPIEFVHRDLRGRVSQREVGPDTEGWSSALRHALRQSPDVIVIGELRDLASMQVAISAALTGHLVLASLHTIDAVQTVQRILSTFHEGQRSQVALDLSICLQGIISQRLLPRSDGDGRVVAVELLTNTPPVAMLLREQRTEELHDLMRGQRGGGMQTFNEALVQLLRLRQISHEVALAYASNPEELALAARGISTGVDSLRDARDEDELDIDLDMQRLLTRVLALGASDLHLAVGRAPQVRISGRLQPLGRRPLSDGDLRGLLYSILSTRQRSHYEVEREIDFGIAMEGGRRFRVNAYFQKGRMAAALRAIPNVVPSPEALGIPDSVLELANRPQGLLLVVGPTGAGKSTTQACLVDRINRTRACRIITIEDPVEYVHPSVLATVDQREVFADTQSFAAALKYILRQDPDVIMVGEMRDLETISSALTAAETGHLVMATLHANDAIQAIDRIIDVFPSHQQAQARAMLAGGLLGVVSQRLIPRREGGGRVGAFEVLTGTPAIRNLIRENKLHQARSAMETAQRDGMVTLDTALKRLYEQGEISYEDALLYILNPKVLSPPMPAPPMVAALPPERVRPAAPAAPPSPPSSGGFWGKR
jgi:twitching motility protein PilT